MQISKSPAERQFCRFLPHKNLLNTRGNSSVIQSPEYEDIISWSPDNVSFTIKNVQAFSR